MKHFDTAKMAEIIFYLTAKYGNDELVTSMISHLIRDESDYLVPELKSSGVIKLEQKYGVSLAGLARNKIWPKNGELSAEIIVEHGLPINQAIKLCGEAKNAAAVAAVLEDLKKNLTYITRADDAKLRDNGFTKRRPEGKNWIDEAYKKCGIELLPNS